MRTALWAGLLAIALTAGCLGGVEPAQISEQKLNDEGWSQSDSSEQSVAMGLGQIATRDYRPGGQGDATGVTVATTTNIPILDENRFVPRALEKVEKERGIDFKKAGTTTISLPELGAENVEAELYDFRKSGASGKAILFTPEQCDSFVVTVGYGVTGTGGLSASEATYQEAKNVARNVVC